MQTCSYRYTSPFYQQRRLILTTEKDIKSDNILQEIADSSILEAFNKAEMDSPSPRKFVNSAPIYASRRFKLPKIFGRAVLSDFGSAVRGDEKQDHDAQPNVYRSPEVMLMTEWSYPVDIWNVGVMVCYVLLTYHCCRAGTNANRLDLGSIRGQAYVLWK